METTVGIDEAGRGPLAGPVAVGAVLIREDARAKRALTKAFPNVRDSKQLSPKKRDEWFSLIQRLEKAGHLSWTVSFSSAKTIDEKGITRAIGNAITRSLQKLVANPKSVSVLLDGGLKASKEYTQQKTIVRGDATHLPIALASICAKVLRDRRMERYALLYPVYAFEEHKGYGTIAHRKAIRKHGLSKIHRKSFCRGVIDK